MFSYKVSEWQLNNGKNSIFMLYIPVADVDSTIIAANFVVTQEYYCGFLLCHIWAFKLFWVWELLAVYFFTHTVQKPLPLFLKQSRSKIASQWSMLVIMVAQDMRSFAYNSSDLGILCRKQICSCIFYYHCLETRWWGWTLVLIKSWKVKFWHAFSLSCSVSSVTPTELLWLTQRFWLGMLEPLQVQLQKKSQVDHCPNCMIFVGICRVAAFLCLAQQHACTRVREQRNVGVVLHLWLL